VATGNGRELQQLITKAFITIAPFATVEAIEREKIAKANEPQTERLLS